MIDQNRSNSLRFSQAKVHGDPSLPVLIDREAAPECKTSADWTKIERQCAAASEGRCGSRDVDPATFVVVRPECSIATARRAVASGSSIWSSLKPPLN